MAGVLNVCRTCESSSNLTLVDSVPYLHQMLKNFLNLDPFPQQEVMCTACIKVIQDFKVFEIRSVAVDAKLRQRLDFDEAEQSEEIVTEAMEEVVERLSLHDSSGDEGNHATFYSYDLAEKHTNYVMHYTKQESEQESEGELISADYPQYTVYDPLLPNEDGEVTTSVNPILPVSVPTVSNKKKKSTKKIKKKSKKKSELVSGKFSCECCKKKLPKSIISMHLKLQ